MVSSTLLLAIIAAATVIMAVVQIGVVICAVRLAGRVNRLAAVVENDIKPTLARVDTISTDVARMTSLASAQAERLDKMVGNLSGQVDEILAVAQDSIVTPVKQGGAFLVGLRAALLAFRGTTTGSTSASTDADDETDRVSGDGNAVSVV